MLVFSASLFAQSDAIDKKNKELLKVKNEIKQLENELRDKSAKERKSTEALNNLNKQTMLLDKLVLNLKREEKKKDRKIQSITQEIEEINKNVAELKKDYSRYVVWLFKNRETSFWKYLLDAKSLSQAMVRYKYLQSIADANEKKLSELKAKSDELNSLKEKLKKEILEKEKIVKAKTSEKDILNQKKIMREKIIAVLKNDKSALQSEIEKKRIAEIAIKGIIAKLNDEERKRQETLRTNIMKNKEVPKELKYSYDKFEKFPELKGKLDWPVSSRKVTRKFGEIKNKKLKTVTLNYGIDIRTKKDEPVYAIAGGRVSIIHWIPEFGSVIIITHRNNYRTVYGHLTNISVDVGDEVKAGDKLGTVTNSLEGNIVHFEIWNERNYQNPVAWLKKR
ncbi:MAG: peptidoglycan DD-metalloendopeptidase family protein [Chlorobi bacterium]|nr:peptidoglycan DD-metalloendopeptidase family protein [Chlorobiota bacterium]